MNEQALPLNYFSVLAAIMMFVVMMTARDFV
jgi:hypothetical protein